MSADRFDLERVHNFFDASLKDEDDVLMDEYLSGYNEIFKFFSLMGSVFSFVSSDLKQKIEILEEFRKKDNGDKFYSIKTMMDYEKAAGLLVKTDYVSGSRTLLRLHRGLDFIREFLKSVGGLQNNDKTCHACQAAYNGTLAKYHPWLVRKGANVAMYAMPTREQLLKKVCADMDRAIEVLPQMLEVTAKVYDRTDNLYTEFDLHSLP
uniref:Putative cytoplasm n=1 Tax=Tabanus bromius TaxID=304241 RepID=A0A0K8TQX9_TABBR